jgi:hypothetical protein
VATAAKGPSPVFSLLLLLVSLAIEATTVDSLPEPAGAIQGAVVNGTQGNQPLAGVAVVLRAGADNEFVVVAETTTDRYGRFAFEDVPLEPKLVHLPGANHDGVHYPGPRVTLAPSNRVAHVTIVVFDALSTPCPLVAKRHDIDVTIEERALRITESLVIANPTRATYVGQSIGPGPPATFWLSIPPNFDRVTFDREFFGRRFVVVDHRPITDMPWLPGEREMRFTYRVPLAESAGQFRRTVDVPSARVRVRVHAADQRTISCNLPRAETSEGPLAFVGPGGELARGFTIELQIASLPFPWQVYGRWGAIVVLAALAGATAAIPLLRRRRSKSRPGPTRQQMPRRRRAA